MQTRQILGIAVFMLSVVSVHAAELATKPVRIVRSGEVYSAEGVVEAVRQSSISPQITGRITQLAVKAGDRVQKGQLLVKIDSESAAQMAAASQAQVNAANAQSDVARKELERQKHLFQKKYISQAALEQSVAQFKATQAAVNGSLAQSGAAKTQVGFFTIVAPFGGTIANVTAEAGDMALPGKPLLMIYDPAEMRVLAAVPQSKAGLLQAQGPVRLELTALPSHLRWQTAKSMTVLPVADAFSQTVQVRLGVPATAGTLMPGMFSRAYFPVAGEMRSRLLLPSAAVIRRTELTAVYVLTPSKLFQLRQVRLGKTQGDEVEVLAGVAAGERVALDPIAASRTH